MIVDDEPKIRKGLINFIEWKKLECEVVYEAVDGIDARNNLESFRPDIVIADIKMPGLNGLELAQYVQEKHSLIKVIILTGYSDFHFAQSAIKSGVIDFVLKPTSTEKILDAVSKAKDLLRQQSENKLRFQALENKVNYSLIELREKFIHDILSGVVADPLMLEEKMKELDICLENHIILLYEIGRCKTHDEIAVPVEQSRFAFAFKNFLALAFKNYRNYNVFINSRLICTLILFEQGTCYECVQTILPVCKEILEMVDNFMNFEISIGISGMHENCSDMPKAYGEASKALSDKFCNGNRIFIYEDNPVQLENSKKQDNYIISKVIDYMTGNYNSTINLRSIAGHVHVNASYLSRLFHKKTGETITQSLTRLRLEKAKELLNNPEVKSHEAAIMVGFEDPSYFSQAFKKYTGLSPKEYKRGKCRSI